MRNPNKRIILSLAFVIAIAFLTHYFFINNIDHQQDGREVASFGERNSAGQIKWEQNLAKDLSEGKNRPQLPAQVSWQDVFVYEFLRGQYNISVKQGQIEKITLQDQQQGFSIDMNKFMSDYGPKIKKYSRFEIKKINDQSDVVELKDVTGQNAGSFLFNKNDQGHVVEIVVQ